MTINKYLLIILAAFMLTACENETSTELQDSIDEVTPETAGEVYPTALFDPSNSVIPFPNNLLFDGSLDGTLNIPSTDPVSVALNTLDGFSTVAPFSAGFSTSIDPSSISGTSVRVYPATLSGPGGAVVAIGPQLTYGVDYVATVSSVDSSQSTLAIVPLQPLDPQASYMVVITDDVMTASGRAFAPSLTYQLIKELGLAPLTFGDPTLPGALQVLSAEEFLAFDQLRLLVNTGEATVVGTDTTVQVADIIQSWSFTTQSVGASLAAVRGLVGTPAIGPTFTPFGTSPGGDANIYQGTIDLPYYLTAPSLSNPTAILTESWQAAVPFGGENNLTALNPIPAATATVTVPMLISTPVGSGPWQTVIFQHGITRDRTDLLALADTLASAGLAVIAIDAPLHGVNSSSPFYQAGNERTFDVDYVTQVGETIIAAVPDGVVDTSGAHFANLQNLTVLRDNFRQAVADLFALTAAIPSIDVDGGGADFAGDIYFVGHSLGVNIGVPFLSVETDVADAVLAMGGVSFAKIADGSTVFSPLVVNGLAAVGISKGTADYEAFVGAAQTVIDTVDGVNHAATAAVSRGILAYEVIGGDSSPSDLFVPNEVPDANDLLTGTGPTVPAPLAGTEPMLDLMGLTQIDNSQAGAVDLQVVVKFTAGDHRSFLTDDPALLDDPDFANTAVTNVIRTSMASFLGAQGLAVTVNNSSVVEVVPGP